MISVLGIVLTESSRSSIVSGESFLHQIDEAKVISKHERALVVEKGIKYKGIASVYLRLRSYHRFDEIFSYTFPLKWDKLRRFQQSCSNKLNR